MPDITSRQHAIVRAFKSAAQGDDGMMLLDGWHLLQDAADANIEIVTVAVTGAPPTPVEAALLEQVARQCDVFTVTTAVMDAMSPVRTPVGVVAIARRPTVTLPDLLRPEPALVVVAIDVQDPGNVGAMIRSAEAGGATGVLLAGASADPWGWKALRAAMGSTFRLPVQRVSATSRILGDLKKAGIALVATVPRGGAPPHRVDLRHATGLILGGEGPGLRKDVLGIADEQLSIPMRPPVESLNVAVAAALLVYEARRQREA